MKFTIRTNRHTFAPAGVLAAGAAIGLLTVNAADKKETAKPALSEEEATKNWMAAATPGEAHQKLVPWIGEWEVHSKMWMAPGAPPVESDGSAVAHWILGDRYIEMTVKSTIMGQPFEGRAITGYNNMQKTYQSFWIDNMGTSMTTITGSVSADGKTFTFEGKMDDPMTGEKNKAYKFIDRFVSKDEVQSEIHELARGKESKMMEMTYKRKKVALSR